MANSLMLLSLGEVEGQGNVQGPGTTKWLSLRKGDHFMGSNQNPRYLLHKRDDILPCYTGIMTSHCKDPYEPIITMECHKGFERCSPDQNS